MKWDRPCICYFAKALIKSTFEGIQNGILVNLRQMTKQTEGRLVQ